MAGVGRAVRVERDLVGQPATTTRSSLACTSVESIFRGHYVRLVQSLALVCDDKEEAADAVQEAFLQLEARWSAISGFEDPVAWVRRVALNRVLSFRRSLARRARALARLTERAGAAPAADGDDLALRDALHHLSPQQRTAIVLFYFADLPVAEVAATMGVSEGTVNQHLHRGREALRRELEIQP